MEHRDLEEKKEKDEDDAHLVLYPSLLRALQVLRILGYGIALTLIDELFTVIDEKTGAVRLTVYSLPFFGAHSIWYMWKVLFVALIGIFVTSELVSSYYLYVPKNLQKTTHVVLLTLISTSLSIIAVIVSLVIVSLIPRL